MDRDNKYYNVIEQLVKNHRKFAGYEAILDEIIDDVYTHSKSIIDSIDDEGVINSYLVKVVSTSVITVPKKMGLHKEQGYRNITNQKTISDTENIKPAEVYEIDKPTVSIEEKIDLPINEIEDTEIVTEEQNNSDEKDIITEKVNTEFVDKMINSINADSVIEIPEEESEPVKEEDSELNEVCLTEDDEPEENIEYNTEEPAEEKEADLTEDISENTDLEDDTEILENIVFDENTLQENFEESELNPEEEIVELDLTENIEDNTEEDSYEEPENYEIIDIDSEEESEEELEQDTEMNLNVEPDSSVLDDYVEDFEPLDTVLESDEIITEVSDLSEENSVESDLILTEDTAESIDSDFLEESEENADTELQIEDNINLDLAMNEEEDSLSEENEILSDDIEEDLLSQDFDEEKPEEEQQVQEVDSEKTEIVHKEIDYSAFDYTPESKPNETDLSGVVSKLIELNEKEPNLNILKVFDLKYKKNLTIEEIAEELQKEKQDIIAALDEMVKLI